MKEKDLAAKVLTYLGGVGNISNAYNCYTRLRAEVKDVELVKTNEIKGLDGVIGVVVADKQIQVIVGPGKSVKLTQELKKLMETNAGSQDSLTPKEELAEFQKQYKETKAKVRKKSAGSALFKKIAGIFVPIIPAFIACGLLLAISEVIKSSVPGFADTTFGIIFNVISTSVFTVLSIVVGYNACKEFGGAGILGACLAGILTNPLLGTIDNPILTLGVLKIYSGLGGIISVIFVSIASAYFEKLIHKIMPNIIDAFVTPLITLAVMSTLGLFVFMPIGGYVSLGIQKAIEGILGAAPFLLGIVPMFYLLMVLFGVHHVLIPISETLIRGTATGGNVGYSILVPVQLMAGAAEVGAAIYFIITTKNKKMRRSVIQSIPIGLLGIDEPLIWGMTFPLKRLFIPIGIAGGISGGVLAVILNNIQAGSLVPESTGIEASLVMSNNTAKWVFAVTFIGAIILGFIITALIGYKETYEVTNPDGSVTEMEHESSYFAKKVWPNFKNTKFYDKAKKILIVIATPFKKLLTKMHILKPKAKKEEPVVVDKNAILSPLKGNVVPIESLSDKTFSGKVMGDGIAIVPTEGKIYAPIDGTISALLDTKHAYGITSDEGCELLIHIGQNTVNLKGEHFATLVKEGDHIKRGDLLGTFDIKAISDKGYNIATPIIVIAGGDFAIKQKAKNGAINVGDVLFTVTK